MPMGENNNVDGNQAALRSMEIARSALMESRNTQDEITMTKSTKHNDLVGYIIERTVHLSRLTMDTLRQMVSEDEHGSLHAARQQSLGMSKARLIKQILCNEFLVEDDVELPIRTDAQCLKDEAVYGPRVEAVEEVGKDRLEGLRLEGVMNFGTAGLGLTAKDFQEAFVATAPLQFANKVRERRDELIKNVAWVNTPFGGDPNLIISKIEVRTEVGSNQRWREYLYLNGVELGHIQFMLVHAAHNHGTVLNMNWVNNDPWERKEV